MLLLVEVDLIPQKEDCKQNSVWLDSSTGSKVVLILLTEVVALHMRPTVVDIQGLDLEFVFRATIWDVKECLDDSI